MKRENIERANAIVKDLEKVEKMLGTLTDCEFIGLTLHANNGSGTRLEVPVMNKDLTKMARTLAYEHYKELKEKLEEELKSL